jgi:hypothetical protein
LCLGHAGQLGHVLLELGRAVESSDSFDDQRVSLGPDN